jgi:hypothetical protein
MDLLFDLSRQAENVEAHWPDFNFLLIKRIYEADYLLVRNYGRHMQIGAFSMNLFGLRISTAGRDFIESFKLSG